MKCEKCGKEMQRINFKFFDNNGADAMEPIPYEEHENFVAAYIYADSEWTGKDASDEERMKTIECPFCHQYPFIAKEIVVEEALFIAMQKS